MGDENLRLHLSKRKDVGLAGAIIVLCQVLTSFQSTQNVSSEIQKIKEDLSKTEMTRKSDVAVLSGKIDRIRDQLVTIKNQVKELRMAEVELEIDPLNDIVGCSFEKELESWKTLQL